MKDFFQTLKEAFPVLQNHPLAMARIAFIVLIFLGLYSARGPRQRICRSLISRLSNRTGTRNRWLYVSRVSVVLDNWKYYTSESTGGRTGDDIIWTLVTWPGLKPRDSFRLPGVVGMVQAFEESQAKLQGRWSIVHDIDNLVGA